MDDVTKWECLPSGGVRHTSAETGRASTIRRGICFSFFRRNGYAQTILACFAARRGLFVDECESKGTLDLSHLIHQPLTTCWQKYLKHKNAYHIVLLFHHLHTK